MVNKSKIFYSPRIKEIIDFMSVYHTEHQCFPKLDEIGKALNLTKQRVGILLKNAERLGLIKSDNVFMRKYMLTKASKNSKLKVNNYYEL
jgi:SOS-response transcriptional repressor LexA|tara:strand:+ start:180 stop:449 length:270 start_codon:yes stop_codon:yes gene_type:complete